MKKLILALVMLVCSAAVYGQGVDGYGLPLCSLIVQAGDALTNTVATGLAIGLGYALGAGLAAVITAGNATVEAPQFSGWIPFLSVGYDYHFSDTRWSFGPEVGYWHYGFTSGGGGYNHLHLITICADTKLYYKPRGSCKLYGGLDVGAGIVASAGGATVLPAIQLNPIAMRWGSERAAFVAELGLGYKGILQLGANFAL